jgi:hypothetical protein
MLIFDCSVRCLKNLSSSANFLVLKIENRNLTPSTSSGQAALSFGLCNADFRLLCALSKKLIKQRKLFGSENRK